MSLPPKKPDDSECCGSGCNRCVFDVYHEELLIWKRRLDKSQDTTEKVLQQTAYTGVRIATIERATHNSFIYIFASDEARPLISLRAGQHVILRGNLGQESIWRQYTPLDIGSHLKELRLLIKIYEDGKMSSVIQQWKEGDVIDCRGPLGDELKVTNRWESIILIAAGTGITPMAQIIQTILDIDDEETLIVLLYACRTYEEILIKKQLNMWTDHWNFTVKYFLSQDDAAEVQKKKMYNDTIFCHRICFSDIENVLSAIDISKSCAFVCGPHDFEVDMERLLLENDFPLDNVKRV